MRDILAMLAIIAAVVGLGVFRVPDEDALVAAGIRAAAEGAVYQARHPVRIAVEGRTITATGRVESAAEGAALVETLEALDGVEEVVADWTVLPQVAPFVLAGVKDSEGVTLSGHVPQAGLAAELGALLDTEADLPLGAGVPDADWSAVALRAAKALTITLEGRFALTDRALVLEGQVHLPDDRAAVQALLADLPEGYAAELSLDTVDDGTPYALLVTRSDRLGLEIRGKLPPGFDKAALDALGPAQHLQLSHAPLPLDSPGFAQAVAAAVPVFAQLPRGSLSVAPGTVTLSGGPVGAGVQAQLADLRAALPPGYALHDALVPEDPGGPLALRVTWDGQALAWEGRVPRDFAPAALANAAGAGLGAVTLEHAPYPDLADWGAPLGAGLDALTRLRRGVLERDATGLRVEGLAADPAARQAARRALDGVGTLAVDLADDGAPPGFTLRYDAGAGASVTGKLPAGLSLRAMAEALGLERVRGTVRVAPTGDGAAVLRLLKEIAPRLVLLDRAELVLEAGALRATLELTLGVPVAPVAADLPERVTVRAAVAPLSGTRRTHVLRDEGQVFVDGFWLPEPGFAPARDSCNAAGATLPELVFAPGALSPAPEAVWPLARMAAILRACTRFADLSAEIEMQMGSAALPALNRQQSRRRAEALRAAMIDRGVDPGRLSARGRVAEADRVVLRFD
ncbi:BON domain-containing protein [Pseudoponticoccus marisrubri]|uniref:BON domain-containing protein n=1 Tax=Pseudoponticoccus marisrubri TaxID=1685382 RepID=A0A0W7WI20_9RHOB|nr:BON domain-containing protein [Pseudoponticoccus marisrubri]KUF10251.1 hypothetical protein AVJ23_12630 [Pseudoponticoccus marisrubri]